MCADYWSFTFSIPRRYDVFWKELDQFKNYVRKEMEFSLENAGLVALFGVECYAWFFGGEIIGRGGTLTGYYV